MADPPISTTNELELGLWGNGQMPGASALDDNWTKIDAGVIGNGSSFPATYTAGKLFLKDIGDGLGILYRNTGTKVAPVWTVVLSAAALSTELDAETAARIAADSSEATTRAAADSTEAGARIAADSAEASARIAGDAQAVGGDLTGTLPNPTIAANAVTDTKVASANKDGTAGTPSMRTLGAGAQQAAAGNDSRLSDARTPTAHAASHQNGGSDEVATATPAPNVIPKAGAGGQLDIGFLASGTPTGTKFVRDDGTLAVPAGGSGIDIAEATLLKSFFTHNSFLPAGIIQEQVYDFPAPDFTNLAGATVDRSMSKYKITPAGAGPLNFGWDLGALKSKVLVVFGQFRLGLLSYGGIFLSSTLPVAGEPPDGGYLAFADGNAGEFHLYKHVSGAYASVAAGETKIAPPIPQAGNSPANANDGVGVAYALYYDDATDRLVIFTRHGSGIWMPIVDATDATFTTMRYVGWYFSYLSGTPTQFFGCPVGIYADA